MTSSQDGMAGASPVEWALRYREQGWRPIPLDHQSKKATEENWPESRIEAADIEDRFRVAGGVGLLLGTPSGGLTDVDLDTPEAVRAAARLMPTTPMVSGRESRPQSHHWYSVEGAFGQNRIQFADPLDGQLLLEIRSSKHQTMVPPSIHPSGERVVWDGSTEPRRIEAEELVRASGLTATATFLARHWGEWASQHHDLALYLSGGMLRGGYDAASVEVLLETVCEMAGDHEPRDRIDAVRSTARALDNEGPVKGWPALAEIIGQDATKRIRDWLGLTGRELDDDRPVIFAGEGNLDHKTAAAWKALVEANEPPTLFLQGGVPVRIEHDREREGQIPKVLTIDRARHRLAETVNWLKTGARGDRFPANPPLDIVRNVLATPTPPLPVLNRIVSAPIFAADGTLQTEPGYSAAARVFLDLPADLVIPVIPEKPTADEVAHARSLLVDELLVDFPFVSEADQANAVALLLLPFGRELITGPTPLHLAEAPTEGTGKGLLVQTVTLLVVGKTGAAMMTEAGDEEEWRKRITTALMEGSPFIVIDNVKHKLSSGQLQSALTTSLWSDRILGTNQIVRIEPRCVWIATGNNPEMDGETARRTVRIRMDAGVERPFLRGGFKHELPGWADQHRGELIGAALTLWRAWLAAGRPLAKQSLGSYESWIKVMGGVLNVAGIPGFMANALAFYEERIRDEEPWYALVERWAGQYGEREVKASELWPLAEEVEGFDFRAKDEQGRKTQFGMALAKRVDRVYGEQKIARGGPGRSKANLYRLVGMRPPSPPHTPAHPTTPSSPRTWQPPPENRASNGSGLEGVQGWGGCAGRSVDEASYPGQDSAQVSSPIPTDCGAPSADLHGGRPESSFPPMNGEELGGEVRLVTEVIALDEQLPMLKAAQRIAVDTETTGLDPLTDHLRLVTLATPEVVLVVDVQAVPEWVTLLAPVFADDRIVKVFHHAKFDVGFLTRAGVSVAGLFDTMLASQLLDGGLNLTTKVADPIGQFDGRGKPAAVGYHTLAAVAHRELGIVLDKTLQTADWDGPLTADRVAYAGRDAAVLLPLHARLTAQLAMAGLASVADVECRAVPALAWLEATGAPLDVADWMELRDRAVVARDTLAVQIAEMLPNVNLNAPAQVTAALAGLGIAVDNAQEATLKAVADRHPVIGLILDCKAAARRASTYGEKYAACVRSDTGRIHASYQAIGAASGRMACSKPNLQNVPRDVAYRACFRAPEGRLFVKADYSQIELRIVAELSNDAAMREAYRQDEDLHALTARKVLGREPEKADRQVAKALNFGLIYGMGTDLLRRYAANDYGVELSENEAQRFQERFFEAYPGVRRWHRSQADGPVETRTLLGRCRRGVERFTEKLNTPVQGTGADILKLALARLWEDRTAVPSAVPVLVVHDEIVIEVDAAEAEAAKEWVRGHMEAAGNEVLREVPVVVEAMVARDWGGADVA